MYTSPIMMFEPAQAKQRDLLAQAETYRRARHARVEAAATQPSASRRSRARQLLRPLRAQAQS